MSAFYSSSDELAISDSSNRSYVIIIVRLDQASTKFIYALINFISFRACLLRLRLCLCIKLRDLEILPKATADNFSLHWSWPSYCQPTRMYECILRLRFSLDFVRVHVRLCATPLLLASVGHMSKNWRKFDQNFNWSPCSDSVSKLISLCVIFGCPSLQAERLVLWLC